MKKIIIYLAICGALFGAGLGLSLFLEGKSEPEKPVEEAKADIFEVVPADPNAEMVDPTPEVDKTHLSVPIVERGKPLSAEEMFRFGEMYREQQTALDKRSKDIETREAKLKLIHDDLIGSRKELDGLRAQMRDLLHRSEQALIRLEEKKTSQIQAEVPGDTGDNAAQPVAPDSQDNAMHVERIKTVAKWMSNMPAEQAARYIRELADEGKQDEAAELLAEIEDRDVAKILAEIDSPAVIYEITETFKKPSFRPIRDGVRVASEKRAQR